VAVGLSDGVAVGLPVGVAVGLSDGVAVGLPVGVAVGLSDGVAVGLPVGVVSVNVRAVQLSAVVAACGWLVGAVGATGSCLN